MNFNEKLLLEIRAFVCIIGCCPSLPAESVFVEGALQAQALLSCGSYGLDVPSIVLPFAGKEVLLLFPSSPDLLVSPYSLRTSQNP